MLGSRKKAEELNIEIELMLLEAEQPKKKPVEQVSNGSGI